LPRPNNQHKLRIVANEEHDPASEIGFEGDEEMPQEFRAHLFDAVAHHAGHGKHPGKYKGPPHAIREDEDQLDRPVPSDVDLARLREEIEGPGDQAPPKPPLPPQEALPSPPPLGGKGKGGGKPPSQGTPTAIGEKAAAQPPPGGDF
jgi:hypothetical protein